MTVVSAAKALLEADATLVAAATGGIYDLEETKRLGVNRTTVPGAYDSDGIIKPCVLVKSRSAIPDGALADDGNQYVSLRQILEVWFYQDSGYSTIETMRNRVYLLLQAKQLDGTFMCYWNGDLTNQRDEEMDASVERSEFVVRLKKSA